MPANIHVNNDGSINVRLMVEQNSLMDVNIKSIDGQRFPYNSNTKGTGKQPPIPTYSKN